MGKEGEEKEGKEELDVGVVRKVAGIVQVGLTDSSNSGPGRKTRNRPDFKLFAYC
jgi:hypothetical protein